MAKAKEVYAKLQKDLDAAKRERLVHNNQIDQAQQVAAITDKKILASVTELLPWAEKLVPAMFNEKRRLEKEVLETVVTHERSMLSFTGTRDEALKVYHELVAIHTSFELTEKSRLRSDDDYVSAKGAIKNYDEARTRALIDDLAARVERQENRLGDHWLIKAAYHNRYGQDGYRSEHFLQDLFGMLCVRLKRTNRYNNLVREVEYAKEALADAQTTAETKAAAASSASTVAGRMIEETRTLIETHAHPSAHQKTIADTAAAAVKREAQALVKAMAQRNAIKAWTHPVAKAAKDEFYQTLIGHSDVSANLRTTLANQDAAATVMQGLMNEIATRKHQTLAISDFDAERRTLAETIDKLESLSGDMRRKSLSNSSREIAKADDFMAGRSIDSGFDLSTLVAVTIVLDAVIDATPQDTSFSSSSFNNDSYSSSTFD
jgi:hypothetical protein